MKENSRKEKNPGEKIREIEADIESYRKAIENAEGALAEAETEINELLADACDRGELAEP